MGTLESRRNRFGSERAELDMLLSSGEFGRANNLARMLSFVCERYFEGKIDEIKEYSIAVEALGRPRDFDPQADAIVRVTAHALRKRLEDYYRTIGLGHAVHICLPPGHYIPKFIHHNGHEATETHSGLNGGRLGTSARDPSSPKNGFSTGKNGEVAGKLDSTEGQLPAVKSQAKSWQSNRAALLILVLVGMAVVFGWYRWGRAADRDQNPSSQAAAAASLSASVLADVGGNSLRARAGSDQPSYVDRAGFAWEKDHFCSGGQSFSVTGHAIQGTNDPELFSAGRSGIFHCAYPVPAGTYEIRLLFAETSKLLENSRHVGFSVNGASVLANMDVVDDAGGDDIATSAVWTDVKPEKDGAIHLDSTTQDSFLNAIEIVPSTPHRMLPVRITTGPSLYRDKDGNVWLPDRFFSGGRVSHFVGNVSRADDSHLYEWHRYGHFHYTIPVTTGNTYTLKLHFVETWFGGQGGAVGGEGSRVFDVSCNGKMLLEKFDIFGEAGAGSVVKTFTHVEPTGQGKIEIYFTPRTNYPSVSAIEVIPE